MSDRNYSKLKDHKLKKGRVITPFNDALGDKLTLNSWALDRLPEYLWLALIMNHYGRSDGFGKTGQILFNISRMANDILAPRISLLLALPTELQRNIYAMMCEQINPNVLAPLTVLFRERTQPFSEYFFNPEISIQERIKTIEEVLRLYSPHQSNEATDIRYLSLRLQLFNGRIVIAKGLDATAEALKNYPYTPHDDEKMRLYRPLIRSMEGADYFGTDKQFVKDFWREIGMITQCRTMCVQFEKESEELIKFIETYISDTKDILKFVLSSNKEQLLSDSKFAVLVGSVSYSVKILSELVENNLGERIIGRLGIRIIIEIYIMMKYLLSHESENPNIWFEYQLYGISKYKLVLLKAREYSSLTKDNHMAVPLMEAIVNEKRMEEFIDIDLRYFDQQGIREKSIQVGEKELYDLFYDYDSSFAHGLWGAIRESSMLVCDNPAHKFHNVPDIDSYQMLPGVLKDCLKIMKRLIGLISDIYKLPEWYLIKYREDNDVDDQKDDTGEST